MTKPLWASQDATVRFIYTRIEKHVVLSHSGPDLICTDSGLQWVISQRNKGHSCALRDGDTIQIGDIG